MNIQELNEQTNAAKRFLKKLKLPTNKKQFEYIDKNGHGDRYQISLYGQDALEDAMKTIRSIADTTNFNYEWGQWAAFAKVNIDGTEYTFNSPQSSNGDNNYWNYHANDTYHISLYASTES